MRERNGEWVVGSGEWENGANGRESGVGSRESEMAASEETDRMFSPTTNPALPSAEERPADDLTSTPINLASA